MDIERRCGRRAPLPDPGRRFLDPAGWLRERPPVRCPFFLEPVGRLAVCSSTVWQRRPCGDDGDAVWFPERASSSSIRFSETKGGAVRSVFFLDRSPVVPVVQTVAVVWRSRPTERGRAESVGRDSALRSKRDVGDDRMARRRASEKQIPGFRRATECSCCCRTRLPGGSSEGRAGQSCRGTTIRGCAASGSSPTDLNCVDSPTRSLKRQRCTT